MIVPEFWSEAKERITSDGRQRTIKRFGWSDISEEDAHKNAQQRVSEAIDRVRAGENVRPMDHKVSYNGAEGLPIREEVVGRHGDAVITRNSYGALCLNTPDTVFADIDVNKPGSTWLAWIFFLLFIAGGVWFSQQLGSWWVLAGAALLGIIVGSALAELAARFIAGIRPDPFEKARERVKRFAADNPDWLLRLYRTPKGFRVLVMHRTFDPTGEQAFEFMKKLDSDPIYILMCRNQKCYRARISPKPWRIDMERLRPRPGVWPIKKERMAARREWVRRYEEKAHHFSSCRYEATFGNGRIDRKCEAVRSIHDRYCKADQSLALA